jgi:lysyl-tRNA synthetase class II
MSEFRFPAYRKLSNNKSFYRIDDDRTFFEIQVIGNKCFLTQTEAKQYPEIIRIADMLSLSEPFIESTIDEFHLYYTKSIVK